MRHQPVAAPCVQHAARICDRVLAGRRSIRAECDDLRAAPFVQNAAEKLIYTTQVVAPFVQNAAACSPLHSYRMRLVLGCPLHGGAARSLYSVAVAPLAWLSGLCLASVLAPVGVSPQLRASSWGHGVGLVWDVRLPRGLGSRGYAVVVLRGAAGPGESRTLCLSSWPVDVDVAQGSVLRQQLLSS